MRSCDDYGRLVLSRTTGSSVVINESITVTVGEMIGDRVDLIFSAPRSIPIHREEVQHRINVRRARGFE